MLSAVFVPYKHTEGYRKNTAGETEIKREYGEIEREGGREKIT